MTRRLLLLALLLLAPAGRARAEGHTHQHPDVTFRIDQALLEAPAMREAVTKAVKGKIRGLHIGFKEDGLHIGGKYVVPIIGGLDFEAVVGFVWIGPDAFDLRVHKITVFAIDITSTVLEIVQTQLTQALNGVCTFKLYGQLPDGTRAVRVTTDVKALMPALPALQLSGINTRDKTLILKLKMP